MLRGTFIGERTTLSGGRFPEAPLSSEIPMRRLTGPPGFHWFGYYDKFQFSPDGRFILGNEVDFENRSPRPNDPIGVGMVDTVLGDRWVRFGTSRAWSWQQGCMLQWRPGRLNEVIWNDAVDEPTGRRFIARLLNIETGRERILPRPVYTLSPDGRYALTLDFARIDRMRVGYGYAGARDATYDENASERGGVFRMDLDTGETRLILSYAEAARRPHLGLDVSKKWHYFNVPLVNPDGTRFLVLHRYRDAPLTDQMRADPRASAKYVQGKYGTRMFTAGMDGSDVYEIDPGDTSHIIWRDPEHVLAWTRGQKWEGENGRQAGYWLLRDRSPVAEPVGKGVMTENGHQTYVPNTNNEWILNDTYPSREDLKQTLYLYHLPTNRKVVLGRFYLPPEYTGEWRTDLHARVGRDGRMVCIDSAHEPGIGRQMYLLDISPVVGP